MDQAAKGNPPSMKVELRHNHQVGEELVGYLRSEAELCSGPPKTNPAANGQNVENPHANLAIDLLSHAVLFLIVAATLDP